MPTPPAKPPRVWQPRPSAAARARILGAVRALLAAPDAKEWTTGYAVRTKHLAELLAGALTYPTLRCYLSALASAGDLCRVAPGLYALSEVPAGPDHNI